MNTILTLMCPGCGSNDLQVLGTEEYQCEHCGTRFMITHARAGLVNVILLNAGSKPIYVIKAILEVSHDEISLKDFDLTKAKHMTDSTPCTVAYSIQMDVAERVKAKLEKFGAKVELKPV